SGSVSGDLVYAPFGGVRPSQDPHQIEDTLNRYMAQWKGKLKGKVVLFSAMPPIRPTVQPLFERYSDKQLSDLTVAPEPRSRMQDVDMKNLKFPDDPDAAREFQASLPSWVTDEFRRQRDELTARRVKFLRDEGALAVLTTGTTSHNSLLFAQ